MTSCQSHHSPSSQRRLWLSGFVILMICCLEGLGAYFSGSLALLADAGHLLSDVFAVALAIYAAFMAQKAKDQKYTFGYGRYEVVAAFLSSLLLLLAALSIIISSLERWYTDRLIDTSVVTEISFLGLLMHFCNLYLLGSSHHGYPATNLNIKAAFLHVLSDVLGAAAVFISSIIIHYTAWHWLDAALSCFIGIGLLVASSHLLKQLFPILLEAAPYPSQLQEIKNHLSKHPAIETVGDTYFWQMDPQHLCFAAKLTFLDQQSAETAVVLEQLEAILKKEFHLAFCFLSPEISRKA